MKRTICGSHINYVKNKKSAMLSSEDCSVCKRESKIGPLRLANLFRILASDLQDSYENPHYDPMGICIQDSAKKAISAYFRLIHPAYGKPLLESLMKSCEEEKK